jgi:hypothetical protein
MQGKLFVYHWIPAFAPLVLLSGAGLRECGRATTRWVVVGLMLVVVAAGVPGRAWVEELYPLYNHYRRSLSFGVGAMSREEYLEHYGGRGRESSFSYLDDEDLAALVKERTGPDETVLVWGFEPLVNFLADRRSPSRFSFDYPLTFEVGSPAARLIRQRNREVFLSDLHRSPPRMVALACGDRNPVEALDSLVQMKGFPELARFLYHGYRRAGTAGHFLLLERRAE